MKPFCIGLALALLTSGLFAADVPKPLKARFIVGDPVWREIPLRNDLHGQYDKCWQTAVSTILDNDFDIATMDKDSGYIRTTWNEGVVVLGGNWGYKVQISLKFVYSPVEANAAPNAAPLIDKVRVQAAREISEIQRGVIKAFFRGYDQVCFRTYFRTFRQNSVPVKSAGFVVFGL